MHVSATRLKLASWLTLPAFLMASQAVTRQAKASPGFRAGRTLLDKGLVFWTLTLWDSPEAMRAYRDNDRHGAVMPKLIDWCCEASVAQWEADALPSWSDAHQRMTAQGRASRLKRPTAAHAGLAFPLPAAGAWRDQAF